MQMCLKVCERAHREKGLTISLQRSSRGDDPAPVPFFYPASGM